VIGVCTKLLTFGSPDTPFAAVWRQGPPASICAAMLLEIHEILCLSQLSAGGAISFQVFLLDQTATSLPDLFHALSDLKYTTD